MLKRLVCAVIGHQYRVLRRMNPGARKVGCDRCGCTWGMHDATRSFVPWDGELEALYAPDGMLAQTLRNPPSNDLGNRRDAVPIGGASVLTDELCHLRTK